jgi:hypothetical protein
MYLSLLGDENVMDCGRDVYEQVAKFFFSLTERTNDIEAFPCGRAIDVSAVANYL